MKFFFNIEFQSTRWGPNFAVASEIPENVIKQQHLKPLGYGAMDRLGNIQQIKMADLKHLSILFGFQRGGLNRGGTCSASPVKIGGFCANSYNWIFLLQQVGGHEMCVFETKSQFLIKVMLKPYQFATANNCSCSTHMEKIGRSIQIDESVSVSESPVQRVCV
ncbi:hypothetical protein AFL94_07390 [Arthrobacter sp. LS16]|nr:hypothetical protein AFL94_07390 [Arthrobacter sp. LS16]